MPTSHSYFDLDLKVRKVMGELVLDLTNGNVYAIYVCNQNLASIYRASKLIKVTKQAAISRSLSFQGKKLSRTMVIVEHFHDFDQENMCMLYESNW